VAEQRSNGKQQRAASRERRRAQAAPEPPDEAGGNEALHAARAAAAAAVVGAAVGAARAVASRRDDADAHAEDPIPPEDHQDPNAPDEAPPKEPPREEALREEARNSEQPRSEQPRSEQPRAEPPERPRTGASGREAAAVVRRAREQLRDLQGSEPESVSSLEQSSEGWLVTLEVVEVRRVPDSTDVLASYEVELDDDGGLLGYRRVRRYYRAQSDANGEGS
jgi:hypothetical protein